MVLMGRYSFFCEAPCAPTFLGVGDWWLHWLDLPRLPRGDSLLSPSLLALGQSLESWSPIDSGQNRQRGALRQKAALWPGRWQWAQTVGRARKRRMGRDSKARTAKPASKTASAMAGGRSNRMEVEGVHPAGVRCLRR